MTDIATETKPDEIASPPAEPSPAPSDTQTELDRALSEWEAAQQPQPEPPADNTAQAPGGDNIDQLLTELGYPPAEGSQWDVEQIGALQTQIDSYRAIETERQIAAAATQWVSDLQRQCSAANPDLPDNFVEREVKVMLVDRKELEPAFRVVQTTTAEQRQQAAAEYRQLEATYRNVERTPDSPQRTQALQQLNRRGQEIWLQASADNIVRTAIRDVRSAARHEPKPIDEEATADRNALAFFIRQGGSGRTPPAEPPVRWGDLSGPDGRRKVKEQFGFDPGW
jgi:hypothetical protein